MIPKVEGFVKKLFFSQRRQERQEKPFDTSKLAPDIQNSFVP